MKPRHCPLRSTLAATAPLVVLVLALLAGCGAKDEAKRAAPPGGAMPPPPAVGVVAVAPQVVALQTELPGRVEPVRVAQVRARVNGVVLKRQFVEGSEVRAGQPLFLIDPAPYQAALDSARAQLARAEANLAQARATAERYKPLAAAQAISQQDYANALASQQSAEADVAAGRAALQSARINLGYAQVTAPIAGRVGRALVTEGALVSAAEATQLALVQQIDTVYVNLTQSSAEVLRLRRAMEAGQLRRTGGDAVAVHVLLEDGSPLPRPGRLLFSDLSVDTTSGQVTLRAEVPNPDGLLLPGQYVRVRLAQARATAERYKPLAAAQAISQQDYANALAAQQSAAADVAAGRAAVQAAAINLGYAQVTAPIAGRIGRALVTEGALVSAAEATQLALIQQTSTVYVNFTQSSGELLRLRRAMAGKQLRRAGGDAVAVRVVLDDGSELPRPGKLLFSDVSVDASSGQVTLRAEVPNAEGLLLPGQYVRVRLSQAELPAGFLLPQQAVTRSAQGDTVLVVGEGNKPAPRLVTVSSSQNGQWIVTDGLKAGDRVIVDGFQKLAMIPPGAPVSPVPWQPPGSAPAGSAAPASAAASAAAPVRR